MALKQQLTQKLEQRLSPQQIQLMKLLQVPTMELDQRIKPLREEGASVASATAKAARQMVSERCQKHRSES